jgi:hypothetical protein
VTLCERERPLVSKILKVAHPHFTIGLNRNESMFRRFSIAILSIIISGLKFICNMLSLVISHLTKQEMPLFKSKSEVEESIERSHMVVESLEDDEDWYENPIKY